MKQKLNNRLLLILEKICQNLFHRPISSGMKKFIVNLGLSSYSTFLVAFVMMITQVIAARIIGPDEYGNYAMVER